MKLVSISLVSWLSGLLLLLLTFSLISQQGITELDLNSTTITSLIMAALVFSLAYAPSLSWLRRRMAAAVLHCCFHSRPPLFSTSQYS